MRARRSGGLLSLGPEPPAWSGRPQQSPLPFGPCAPPPTPAACPGSSLPKRKLLPNHSNWSAAAGLLWRDSRSQGAGARVGRNTWGARGHRAAKTTLSSVAPGQGQPCFHPIPITNLIRLDIKLQIRTVDTSERHFLDRYTAAPFSPRAYLPIRSASPPEGLTPCVPCVSLDPSLSAPASPTLYRLRLRGLASTSYMKE